MELFIERAKFTAQIKEEAVPMKFTGELQGVDLRVTSLLPLPMREEYVRDLLLNLKGRFTFQSVKSGLAKIGPSSFKVLPAPLNSMDGSLVVDLQGHEPREHEWVSLDFDTRIDL